MAPKRRWRRILQISAITLFVLVAGMAAFVQIQQHILRWRAERLLADIRALQLGKSTWADAQRIIARWGAWGNYDGSCTQKRCSYKIVLKSFECPLCIYRPVQIIVSLATRDAYIEADLEVIDGIVWGKDFAVTLDVLGNVFKLENGYGLLASARTVWRTADFNRYISADHSDYVVGQGHCTGCESVYSKFTPFVDPSISRNLMDFNLDCVTRLFECRDQVDIMPRVWRQVQAEERQLDAARAASPQYYRPPTPSPEFLGRDRVNVVIAEVVSTRIKEGSSGPIPCATFRLDQQLKRATFWDPGQVEEEYLSPDIMTAAIGDGGKLIAPGRRVILAFDNPYQIPGQQMIDLGDYEALPLTEENLAAIRKGMLLDIFPAPSPRFS